MRPRAWLAAFFCCIVLAAAIVSAAPPSSAAPKTEPAYRGNTNTHKFHKRSCRYYSCPNCTAKFETREEAIAAGYRPCGTCEP